MQYDAKTIEMLVALGGVFTTDDRLVSIKPLPDDVPFWKATYTGTCQHCLTLTISERYPGRSDDVPLFDHELTEKERWRSAWRPLRDIAEVLTYLEHHDHSRDH